MRVVAYLLICAGVFFLISAVNSERSGEATAASPGYGAGDTLVVTTKRSDNPAEFRRVMTYLWIETAMIFLTGIVTLVLVRRAERLNPFSDRFGSSEASDDLERTLSEVEKRREGR